MIQEWCERKGIASAQVDFIYLNYNAIYRILHYYEGEFAKERTVTAEDPRRICSKKCIISKEAQTHSDCNF